MTYQSISINHPDDLNPHSATHPSRKQRYILLFAAASLAYITVDWLRLRIFDGGEPPKLKNGVSANNDESRLFHHSTTAISDTINHDNFDSVPIPTGVNLGSWLSLEDWFYVGDKGAVEVASPDDAVAASCLPPLHLDGSTGPRWNSETDLLEGLGEFG